MESNCNKFKPYEVVKVVDNKRKIGFHNDEIGYVIDFKTDIENDEIIYNVFLHDFEVPVKFSEYELASENIFLSDDEIEKRERCKAVRNRYEKWEIINANIPDDISVEAYVYDMDKSFHTGKWSYGVSTLKDHKKYWLAEEKIEKLNSKLLTNNEIEQHKNIEKERQEELDRVEPLTWREKMLMDKLTQKAKQSDDKYLKMRVFFANKLRKMIDDKETKSYIGKWVFDLDFNFKSDIDSELGEVLYTLSFMGNSSEHEFGYRELDEVSKALIFGEDLSRWT